MKNFNNAEFQKELMELVEAYGLKEVVFGAVNSDGKFIGLFNLDQTLDSLIKSGYSAARLYQAIREKVLKGMDGIK